MNKEKSNEEKIKAKLDESNVLIFKYIETGEIGYYDQFTKTMDELRDLAKAIREGK